MDSDSAPSGKSYLSDRLTALDALYQRYGRDGLKDLPIAEVGLLLASKEMEFRDAPKGHGLTDEQKAANRHLELEIRDLTAYVQGQVASANVARNSVFERYGRDAQSSGYRQEQRQDRGPKQTR